jgi:hypothetical protein
MTMVLGTTRSATSVTLWLRKSPQKRTSLPLHESPQQRPIYHIPDCSLSVGVPFVAGLEVDRAHSSIMQRIKSALLMTGAIDTSDQLTCEGCYWCFYCLPSSLDDAA